MNNTQKLIVSGFLNLRKLNLSWNTFSEIPMDWISSLDQLDEISLCGIKDLDLREISQKLPKQIKILDLSWSKLNLTDKQEEIGDFVSKISSLEILG